MATRFRQRGVGSVARRRALGGVQRGAEFADTVAPGAPGDASSGKVRIVNLDNIDNNGSSTVQAEYDTGKYLQAASRSQNGEILRCSEGDQAGKTSYRKFSVSHETHFFHQSHGDHKSHERTLGRLVLPALGRLAGACCGQFNCKWACR